MTQNDMKLDHGLKYPNTDIESIEIKGFKNKPLFHVEVKGTKLIITFVEEAPSFDIKIERTE